MKKIIAVVLSTLLMATVLTGCNFSLGGGTEAESEAEVFGTEYEATPGTGSFTVEDITGYWSGTTTFAEVSNAEEMQAYLEGLYGQALTAEEAAALSTATGVAEAAELTIYNYPDEQTGLTYSGSWEFIFNMGDFFGEQILDDWDAISYDEFNNDRDAGCIVLDGNDSFYVDVVETDYLGEYGSAFFGVSESAVMEDGEYGLAFSGTVTEGQINGQMIITFQYGDMKAPYKMVFNYTFDQYEEL